MRDRIPGRARKSQPPPASTPLDEQRKKLEQEQQRLRRELANAEKFVSEAPKMKQRAEKRRRDELVTRASRTEARRGGPGMLLDPRHSFEANVGAMVRTRKLRREKTQGMWTFFLLIAVFVGVVYWIYTIVIHSGAQ
jgi:hypothetical protein